jgi:hypothetical protein
MKLRIARFLAVAVSALLFAGALAADTIELRDGQVFSGQFLGGTQNNVRFLVNGEIKVIPVSEILAITFGTSAPAARTPAAPAQPAVPAPAAESAPVSQAAPAYRVADRPTTVTVPAGSSILITMIDSVDSSRNKPGDRFRASLEADLVVGGILVAPRGADVYGRLVEVREAGRLTGRSELGLELTDILIEQELQPILTGEYEVAGEGRGGDTAKKVGIGAAAGAAIGAIAGGGKGAAIGAGIGAGAGTAIQVMTRGEEVRVPSETRLEFRLREAFYARVGQR